MSGGAAIEYSYAIGQVLVLLWKSLIPLYREVRVLEVRMHCVTTMVQYSIHTGKMYMHVLTALVR